MTPHVAGARFAVEVKRLPRASDEPFDTSNPVGPRRRVTIGPRRGRVRLEKIILKILNIFFKKLTSFIRVARVVLQGIGPALAPGDVIGL